MGIGNCTIEYSNENGQDPGDVQEIGRVVKARRGDVREPRTSWEDGHYYSLGATGSVTELGHGPSIEP